MRVASYGVNVPSSTAAQARELPLHPDEAENLDPRFRMALLLHHSRRHRLPSACRLDWPLFGLSSAWCPT